MFFTNSGVEAVECAIKTARRYHYAGGNPEKHTLISFPECLSRATMATISATDQPKMIEGFAPLLRGFKVVEFDNLEAALGAIQRIRPVPPWSRSRARGHPHPPRKEFIQEVARACDEHDLMLVFDEVQCGVAPTPVIFTPTNIMA